MKKQWTSQEESQAKKEYLLMVDTLKNSDEFSKSWSGNWEDEYREVFGHKKTRVTGDKNNYMKYWLENQKIFQSLNDWDKIEKDSYDEDEYY